MGKKPTLKGRGLDVLLGMDQQDGEILIQQDVKESKQYNSKMSKQEKVIKRTFYITHEEDIMLEKLKLVRKEKGKKIDKSELVREAIRLLAKEEGILK